MGRTKIGVGDHHGRTKIDVKSPEFEPVKDLAGKIVLEHYRVGETIGVGAMGTVYRGEHVEQAQPVAIKVLHAHLGGEPMIVARFHREARAAARLDHPSIASVIDVGSDHGRQILVLELADGPSLGDLVGEPLPAERVIPLIGALLGALHHAHRAGVVHRDLKPENIIITRDAVGGDLPRIVDFGIAALLEDTVPGARLTTTGMVIGTPSYMSPEQAQAEPIDHRADLFSLGVIAYEMLSGRIPFDGSAMEISLAYIGKDPPAIAERAPGVKVSPALEMFVRKLMARSASARFPSARHAGDMLVLVESDPEAAEREIALLDPTKASAMIGLPPTPPYGRKRR